MLRWVPSIVLLVVGVAAGVLAWLARSDTASLSIFVGVASTACASGLVDLSAVIERHRQIAPIRQLAGRRIGRLHQLLVQLIQELFPDLSADPVSAWPQVLREAVEGPIDLTQQARVYPPRSRAERVRELLAELRTTLDDLRALASAGALTAEVNVLDINFRGLFIAGLEAAMIGSGLRNRKVLADSAAELVELLQKTVPIAQTAAGKSWIYGSL